MTRTRAAKAADPAADEAQDPGILKALSRIIVRDRVLAELVGRPLTLAGAEHLSAAVFMGDFPIVTAVVTPERPRGDGSRFRLLQVSVIDRAPDLSVTVDRVEEGKPASQETVSLRQAIAERLVQLTNVASFAVHGLAVEIREVRALDIQPAERVDFSVLLELT